MAVFGGQLRFDGHPVAPSFLEQMGALLARRGPDGHIVKSVSSLGLVCRHYGVDSTLHATSSLWQASDGTLLAFDGRVDNSPELAALLGLTAGDAASDSTILFAGFRRFGPMFAGKVVGDYSCAYWDPIAHELSLARDPVGARTLYYHRSSDALTLASDLGSLVRVANPSAEINDEFVAGFLTCGADEGLTVYRQVNAIPPGHVLTFSCHGHHTERVAWSLPTAPHPILYRDDREYEEHFAHLFRDAIQVRLRTTRPVVAELSGGLDSSSIVCMAHTLRRSGASRAPTIGTVSYLFDKSATTNELIYIMAVERHCGDLASTHIAESLVPYLWPHHAPSQLHVLSTLIIMAGYEHTVCTHMRELGAHLLMSGHGGDEMFYSTNAPLPGLADLWTRCRLHALHRDLRMWSAAIKAPYLTLLRRSFTTGILRGYLPPRALARRSVYIPSWLHPRLRDIARTIAEARTRRLQAYSLPSQRDHAAGYYAAVRTVATGQRPEFDPRQVTYPCLHRPLVEFMHAIPFDQKLRCGESRSLQRRSLSDVLPETIRKRRGKTSATEPIMRCFRDNEHHWDAFFTGSEAAAREYIDASRARAVLHRARAGVSHQDMLNRAIALEFWLRSHCHDRTADLSRVTTLA